MMSARPACRAVSDQVQSTTRIPRNRIVDGLRAQVRTLATISSVSLATPA